MADERDLELRRVALDRVRHLQTRYDDLIPLSALREGFRFGGEQISFGSFYSGIFRPRQMRGDAALCVVTAPPDGRPPPYDDGIDAASGRFTYHFREARTDSAQARLDAARDNRRLLAAHRLAVPVIYFKGIAQGQYWAEAPALVAAVDEARRLVQIESALPVADTTDAGVTSASETRRYATREAEYRLHQQRFRHAVLTAYASRCTVCALRETALLQAAHIIGDREALGDATVVNGIALCAIHHLAYDRNLMGIDPEGVVHIAHRLLAEIDGPMLANGIQHFHGAAIDQPRRRDERPDPQRLEIRFAAFSAATG